MALGLRQFTERVGDGAGKPVLDAENDEELMHVQPGVAIVLDNRTPESPGTLYISTKRVFWLSDLERERGYSVDFFSLSLHAVSTDPEAYPSLCIYTQIETDADEDEESGGSDSECNEILDVSKITEMRLVPSDPNQLVTLFDIFCECAELNPEPVEEQEEEHNWIFSSDQMKDDDMATGGGEDSEWHLSENPANPIGYSNGDHDLARTVLEACLQSLYYLFGNFTFKLMIGASRMHREWSVTHAVVTRWSWWWDGITENYVTKAVVTLLVAILVISWYTWLGKRSMNGKPPLPPGPRGLPVVGYLPFLEADLHRYFAKLAQVYGPIMKLQLGNKLCVVLSSSSLAKEVLKDHDAVFANHDAPVAGLAVTYGGLDIVWSPNGPYWRMLRKVCVREMMSNTSLDACYSLRQQEVREMVRDVYNMTGKPINIAEQAFITTLNVIMNMLWGGTLQGEERSSVGVEFQKVVGDIIELLGKPNISDLFPVLARFDIQGIERQTKEKLSWFDRIFESVIDKRLKMDRACGDDTYKNNKSKDFLQFLLERKQGDDKESLTMIQLKALFMVSSS
ncbi:hypothetical protein HHK36_028734 [Tetracentron sinense]|uniref:Uncharacterized protein n=1 Tax=Tetracentron sinense TaxID=13715 RepID=A0A835D2W7_TETSI|nr:hypothetical protein HHK36_028734 [Tetracentron sinense]